MASLPSGADRPARAGARTAATLESPGIRRLFVLSHPNHEAAIFGMIRRLRPRIVILTDGGGEDRVAQSREALGHLGLLDSTTFLGWREAAFYEALLDRDIGFFSTIASDVAREIERVRPAQILCDAVEFYNPVHDLSLPIARAALAPNEDIPVFEVPLIYQEAGGEERYAIQRLPPSRRSEQIGFRLSAAELEDKIWARDHVYDALRAQLGPLVERLPAEHMAIEVIVPAADARREPATDQLLRYDRRAKLLAGIGEVKRAITRIEHYLPIAGGLLAGSDRAPGAA